MPITIGIITGVAGLAAGGFDMWQGKKKEKEAKEQLENLRRPMMDPSKALAEKSAFFKNMTSPNMPGYQGLQNIADMKLAQAGGAISRGTQTSQDYLAAMQNLYAQDMIQQQQNAYNYNRENFQFQQDFRKFQAQNYGATLSEMAQNERDMFQTNQLQPYQQNYQQLSANMAAGQQQFAQGLGGIGSTISNAAPMIGAGSGTAGWENMRAMYGPR